MRTLGGDGSLLGRLRHVVGVVLRRGEATPPEVHEFQVRGARLAAQISFVTLALLWAVQVFTGAEDAFRASVYCGAQLVVYGSIWLRLRHPISDRGSETCAYLMAATLSMASCFAAWPSNTGTNPYRLIGFMIPLISPSFSGIRPRTAFVLGLQLAAVHPLVALWAPFDNMMSDPQAAVLGLSVGISGAVVAHAQRRLQVELSRARDEALQAARLKSEFLANLSHEIRTPMTSILGYTEMIREELDGRSLTTSLAEAIGAVHRHGRALLGRIDHLVDFALLAAGRLPIASRECRLEELLAAATRAHAESAAVKGIELRVSQSAAVAASVTTDRDRVYQLLDILLDNAIKFTEAGVVELCVEPDAEPGRVCFRVRDTGVGIPVDRLDVIFRPFEQVDGTYRRRVGGTGMGLAIAEPLARRLGGALVAAPIAGGGMEFELRLPWCASGAETLASDAATSASGMVTAEGRAPEASLSNRRILLAEDGPDNQRLMRRILERAGATVDLAEHGQIAADLMLRSLREQRAYDVVLMDIQMPVLDGYAATRQIREAGYEGPIAAVTANVLEADRDRCLEAGCDDYMAKPVRARDLVDLVRTLLEKFEARAPRSR